MHVRITPDNPSPAQPIHIANLHLHIQVFKFSGVELHDGDAVAKERDTPSPQRLGLISSRKSEQQAAGFSLPARARQCFLLQFIGACIVHRSTAFFGSTYLRRGCHLKDLNGFKTP